MKTQNGLPGWAGRFVWVMSALQSMLLFGDKEIVINGTETNDIGLPIQPVEVVPKLGQLGSFSLVEIVAAYVIPSNHKAPQACEAQIQNTQMFL